MLKKEEKQKIIEEFRRDENDTGSSEAQIGLLTEEIKKLLLHLKAHPHDNSSRLGLVKKVNQRRKLLKYLEKTDPKVYRRVVKKMKENKSSK